LTLAGRGRVAALTAGACVLGLIAAACALAWRDDSPLVPRDGGLARSGSAWTFLTLLALALAAYLASLVLLRRAEVRLRVVVLFAAAIQVAPLAAPLLLSTDAWTYWGYGWIAADGGGNPYLDPPAAFPENPALPHLGADWRDTTSVYGPAFTLVSEPVAELAGGSSDGAAWLFKALAAAGILVTVLALTRATRRPALAAALVGWNPVIAVHAAGGGHNDALLAALVSGAVALAVARRETSSGVLWALATLVKWVPLVFFALAALAARARGRPTGIGAALATAVAVGAVATWRYGLDWLGAVGPLVENAERETRYALPSRLEQAGLPRAAALTAAGVALAAGLALLGRGAMRGRARLGRAACLVLATTPYLAVWYLAWAIPLVAADEDDASARIAVLALTAYLLPQAIPT
jgi:alpha-1,6-mannosyltransferase